MMILLKHEIYAEFPGGWMNLQFQEMSNINFSYGRGE